jgi:uncharacterized protein
MQPHAGAHQGKSANVTQTESAARILTLDAVRGVAVMGILLMNIVAFAMPQQAYFQPLAWGAESAADLWAWAIAFVLVDGKMRGLFSLLFGASMLLVIEAADHAGGNGRAVHMRRMVWLLVFGLLHYWLIWFGDILTLYALVGMVAVLFVGKSSAALVKWAIAWFVISFAVWSLFMGGALAYEAAAMRPGAPAEMREGFLAMRDAFGHPGSAAIAQEVTAYRGSWFEAFAHRGKDGPLTPFIFVMFGAAETLGLMLLGMALFKSGFLRGEWDDAAYRRLMVRAYALGLPPSIALAAALWWRGFDTIELSAVSFAFALPFRIAVTFGHAALIMLLIRGATKSALVARLAATGRAAFSNYLGTSVLMTLLFYGYGLGFFGELSRWQIYLVPPFVFAIMLLWSKPWLDRFRYGPLEWVWRTLARGKIQPMRI